MLFEDFFDMRYGLQLRHNNPVGVDCREISVVMQKLIAAPLNRNVMQPERLATRRKKKAMSQEPEATLNDEMRPEYDFAGGVRGKYYEAYKQSINVVVLDPDVAEVFRDSASVNEALRVLTKIAKSTVV
ncbi:hypothetical protein ACKFKF_14595 [Phormidesmis sp. 146-12]